MDIVYYILTFMAAVGYAGGFVAQKLWQNRVGTDQSLGNLFSGLMGAWTGIVLIIIMLMRGTAFQFSWFTLACTGGAMATVIAYRFVGFAMMKRGSMTLFTLFLMVGGMAVPYFYGVIFLKEELPVTRIIGFAVIVAGVVLSNISEGKNKASIVTILLGLAAFVFNGMTGVFLKIHQDPRFSYMALGTEGYMLTQSAILVVISVIMTVFGLIKSGKKLKIVSREATVKKDLGSAILILPVMTCLVISFGGAAINGVADVFQLVSASKIAASAQFPICTGGCIAASALADAYIFKSKLTRNIIIGIVLCILGTCMFVF